jgi:hypothetical protein
VTKSGRTRNPVVTRGQFREMLIKVDWAIRFKTLPYSE